MKKQQYENNFIEKRRLIHAIYMREITYFHSNLTVKMYFKILSLLATISTTISFFSSFFPFFVQGWGGGGHPPPLYTESGQISKITLKMSKNTELYMSGLYPLDSRADSTRQQT